MELRNNRDQSADAVTRDGRQHRTERHRELSADSAQSETPGMHGNSTRENRETPSVPVEAAGRLEKAMSRKTNRPTPSRLHAFSTFRSYTHGLCLTWPPVGSLLFHALLWKRATALYPGKVQQSFRPRLLSIAFAAT
jgi:hypothetical protein